MNPNILPVLYEEVKANPHKVVRKVAQFLQTDMTEEKVEEIVDATSFSKMKAQPTSNMKHIKEYSADFIRQGKVGDWKNHFSEEQELKFDSWITSQITDEELRKRFEICVPNEAVQKKTGDNVSSVSLGDGSCAKE